MDNFDWTQFSKRVYINAELASVYNAWTKSEVLETWFLSKASFFTKDDKKILPSESVASESVYKWNWFAQDYYEEGTINQSNGIDFLEFTFVGDCIVQIQLSKERNQTLVTLTQSKIPLDNNSKKNIRLGCAFGWSFYLLNLKSLLEGGIDLRNKDTEILGVINN